MSKISTRLNGTVGCLALFAGALLAHPAAAQQVAANESRVTDQGCLHDGSFLEESQNHFTTNHTNHTNKKTKIQ